MGEERGGVSGWEEVVGGDDGVEEDHLFWVVE